MRQLAKTGQAGTLESNDIVIIVAPHKHGSGIEIELDSIVQLQFGDAIRETLRDVVKEQEVSDLFIKAVDRGALDCTIRARMLTALERAGVVLKEEVI